MTTGQHGADGARLVLWGGIGQVLYAEAFERATGRPLERHPPMGGRLEPAIFRDALALHGIEPDDELFSRFLRVQAQTYLDRTAEYRRSGRVLPGVPDLLRRLAEHPGIRQTVLTGNSRPTAAAKLAAFGLADTVDLPVGAYGTDAENRPDLVGIARDRVRDRYGLGFTAADTVIIGDTPNDVRAGREGGARVIAVATGKTTAADLRAAGADVVMENLHETETALAAILNRPPS